MKAADDYQPTNEEWERIVAMIARLALQPGCWASADYSLQSVVRTSFGFPPCIV